MTQLELLKHQPFSWEPHDLKKIHLMYVFIVKLTNSSVFCLTPRVLSPGQHHPGIACLFRCHCFRKGDNNYLGAFFFFSPRVSCTLFFLCVVGHMNKFVTVVCITPLIVLRCSINGWEVCAQRLCLCCTCVGVSWRYILFHVQVTYEIVSARLSSLPLSFNCMVIVNVFKLAGYICCGTYKSQVSFLIEDLRGGGKFNAGWINSSSFYCTSCSEVLSNQC